MTYRFKPTDELRAALLNEWDDCEGDSYILGDDARKIINRHFDAWAEKHPFWGKGITGAECPAYCRDADGTEFCRAWQGGAPTLCPVDKPCPVMQARKS